MGRNDMKGYIVIHKGVPKYFSENKKNSYIINDIVKDYTVISLEYKVPAMWKNEGWIDMEDSAEI